jgi:DNA polymerase-3 subunit alpha
VARYLTENDEDRAAEAAGRFSEIFGPGGFYLEIQDHGLEPDRVVNRGMVSLARRLGLPMVATNDCHYLRREHHDAHDALLCIQTGKTIEEKNRLRFETAEFYMKSPDEMRALFAEVPEAIANTRAIADRCGLTLEFGRTHLPQFPVPEGYADADAYLADLARQGLRARFPEAGDELRRRLEYELGVIRQMEYASYFLIVHDFIHYARRRDIPVGPARGSAAGSLVSYCLEITSIDPIRYGLLFERFLNPERISMPDIDVDFSDRGRDEVIRYVVEKYGRESVTQIITFGTMAARGVVRDVGRVLGLSYGEVDRIAKMIPGELGMTLDRALELVPELRALQEGDSKIGLLLSHARALEGLARHASVHAAGVVITPGSLTDFVPLYKSNKDEVTTQFDMGAVEKIGLLKMDFLGLRTLTVIQDAVRMVAENRGDALDLDSVPLDDPGVYRLMQNGETVAIFQFESSGMREYLRKLKPERIEDLIAMNALYRPGPLGSAMIDDFIARKHGRKKIRYEHPLLAAILQETYGVIVYQEQVMRIASDLAGFSLGRADLLRRAMGKKQPEVMAEQREAFVRGAAGHGVARAAAEKIFDLIAHFAGYGFNKSHSAGYAYLAYQTAYLKAHYPTEFLAANMTSETSNSDKMVVLMNEARRLGIVVTPPDVNVSDEAFTVQGDTIHFGLAAVKNVGVTAVRAILEARRRVGRFSDLFQFCGAVDPVAVNRKAIESLIQAGAFDSTDGHRAQLMEALDAAMDDAQRTRLDRQTGQASLFAPSVEDGGAAGPPRLPPAEPWSQSEILSREKKMLGFYVTGHPLARYEAELSACKCRGTAGLGEMSEGETARVGGILIAVRTLSDKHGKLMAFATLEDFEGTVECLVFSDLYQRRRACVQKDALVIVRGRVSEREGKRLSLVADEITPLTEDLPSPERERDPWDEALDARRAPGAAGGEGPEAAGREAVHVAADAEVLDDEALGILRDVLLTYPGRAPVYLHVREGRTGEAKLKLSDYPVRVDEGLLSEIRERLPFARVWLGRPEAAEGLGAVDATERSA